MRISTRNTNILFGLTSGVIALSSMVITIKNIHEYVQQVKLTTRKEVEIEYMDVVSDEDRISFEEMKCDETLKGNKAFTSTITQLIISLCLVNKYNKVCRYNRELVKITEAQDCMLNDAVKYMYRLFRSNNILDGIINKIFTHVNEPEVVNILINDVAGYRLHLDTNTVITHGIIK